jgi:hypothetical protein
VKGLRIHRHDMPLVVLVAANLLAVAGFLGVGPPEAAPGSGGWRRVDIEAVSRRIQAGDLSAREALWYHAARESGEASPQ